MSGPQHLVGPTELAAELQGPRPPLVLDARYNLMGPDGHEEYRQGHVPGAIWIDVDHELSGPPGPGGRHPLPEPAVLVAALQRVGLTPGRPVVAMDGGNLLGAARVWWLLRDFGHDAVRVLDGGFAAWQRSGQAVETGEVEPAGRGDFTGESGGMGAVTVAEVGAGNRPLVDVRTAERFAGVREPIDPVAGHIPGAVNLPAAQAFDDGRFRSAEALGALFAEVPEGAAIYCGSGITASQTLLALTIAGHSDVVLYPGSWSEWITDPSRPVASET